MHVSCTVRVCVPSSSVAAKFCSFVSLAAGNYMDLLLIYSSVNEGLCALCLEGKYKSMFWLSSAVPQKGQKDPSGLRPLAPSPQLSHSFSVQRINKTASIAG